MSSFSRVRSCAMVKMVGGLAAATVSFPGLSRA
jgi:hypothetical protein